MHINVFISREQTLTRYIHRQPTNIRIRDYTTRRTWIYLREEPVKSEYREKERKLRRRPSGFFFTYNTRKNKRTYMFHHEEKFIMVMVFIKI